MNIVDKNHKVKEETVSGKRHKIISLMVQCVHSIGGSEERRGMVILDGTLMEL